MERSKRNRTCAFRWNSRHELYDYFKEKYGLEKKDVDIEIQRVMSIFRPRKGAMIRTQELWQKVGLDIEAEISGVDHSFLPGNDEIVFEVNLDRELPAELPPSPDRAEKTAGTPLDKTFIEQIEELPPQPVVEPPIPPQPVLDLVTDDEAATGNKDDTSVALDDIDEVIYLEDMDKKES